MFTDYIALLQNDADDIHLRDLAPALIAVVLSHFRRST